MRESDIAELSPTGVVLSGLLHHLSDADAEGLLRMIASSSRLARIVTSDIVYLPGRHFNNLLARLDRGKFCRARDGYTDIARRAGLRVEKEEVVASAPGSERVQYFLMSLVRGKE